MRALLVLFMVAPAVDGGLSFSNAEATSIYGTYSMAVYMLSIPGGFVADRILGAKRSILFGGTTIAAGHFCLAVPSILTFYFGLILIALGTGLFKPNISALVGALYAPDDTRRDAGFSLFYMGINLGAFLSPLVTGFLAQSALFKSWLAAAGFDPALSWHWGFAAAGVGMTVSLILFQKKATELPDTVHVDTLGSTSITREAFVTLVGTIALLTLAMMSDIEGYESLRWLFLILPIAAIGACLWIGGEAARRLAAVAVLFIAAMIFWAIFEQQGSTIALFADNLTNNEIAGIVIPSAWYQSINPIFVILFTPLIAGLWLHLGHRQPSPVLKFALGLFLLSASFALLAPAASLAAHGKVSPWWLVAVMFLMTIGELLLSPVGLATMTRLAPARLVGLILGVWFLASAFGNKLAGVLGGHFDAADPERLAGHILFQATVVGAAALALLLLVPWVNRLSAQKSRLP